MTRSQSDLLEQVSDNVNQNTKSFFQEYAFENDSHFVLASMC